jgi:hypothetical protein
MASPMTNSPAVLIVFASLWVLNWKKLCGFRPTGCGGPRQLANHTESSVFQLIPQHQLRQEYGVTQHQLADIQASSRPEA